MSVNLQELLASNYGLKTSYKVKQAVLVTTTVTKLVSNNPNRLGILFVNNGAQDIWMGPNDQVAANQGVRLFNGGGTHNLIWNEDFELVANEWFAVTAIANTNIYILEIVSI